MRGTFWTAIAGLSASASASLFGTDESGLLQKRTGSTLFNSIPASRNITWQPCPEDTALLGVTDLQCAKLLVPVDWKDPENGKTFAIAIMKQPAAVPEDSPHWRGPLLYNPGGPGGEATFDMIRGIGQQLQGVAGRNFSVIAFDPRGVGSSEPEANCLETPLEFFRQATWKSNINARSILSGGYEAAAEIHAYQAAYNSNCVKKYGKDGTYRYIGTAAVARDMLHISDHAWETAGREPKGLQYWGMSYGTLLGQYFATLFPDRIGRLVLDGVVNVDAWTLTDGITTWVTDTDKALDSFSTYCAASKDCSMNASGKESATSLRRRVNAILDYVRKTPFVPANTLQPINFQQFASVIYGALYMPLEMFPAVSDFLLVFEPTVNSGAILEELPEDIIFNPGINGHESLCLFNEDYEFFSWGTGNGEAYRWVKCGDRIKFDKTSPQYWMQLNERVAKISVLGTYQLGASTAMCSGMDDREKFQAVETVSKPGAKKTKNPILFIGNTADPVTPLRKYGCPDLSIVFLLTYTLSSAHVGASKFPGSVILAQEATGHCTIYSPSACTARYIADYFETGKLPKAGTVCQPDEVPFQKTSERKALLKEVLEESKVPRKAFKASEDKGRKKEMSIEEAAAQLGESWRRIRLRKLLREGGQVGI
ncbi:alpha/beta-hydrolase [Ascobolus immersus RN42]|uniref:Alpha/beta-hydrolase n=1 Tax=Ascobolus immersus RN42 TaxID=1160509 RepID=A0A3N4I3L6_ASCIM|nr:alpha/beta-hydrolase [Ascobolus immersus RN42]